MRVICMVMWRAAESLLSRSTDSRNYSLRIVYLVMDGDGGALLSSYLIWLSNKIGVFMSMISWLGVSW